MVVEEAGVGVGLDVVGVLGELIDAGEALAERGDRAIADTVLKGRAWLQLLWQFGRGFRGGAFGSGVLWGRGR